jgi:hypothetical protein
VLLLVAAWSVKCAAVRIGISVESVTATHAHDDASMMSQLVSGDTSISI